MKKLKSILLLEGNNFDSKKISQLKISETYSLDILSHKILENLNIEHFLADNLLNRDERNDIFDHIISKLYWFENDYFKNKMKLENIDMLKIVDPLVLHQHLLVSLIRFSVIKKIIEKEQPNKIFLTQNLSKIVSTINSDIDIQLINNEELDLFDTFDLRFTFLSRPISIKISMNRFKKLKNFYEIIIGKIFNLWLNDNKKPISVLLEFDPTNFEKLFSSIERSKSTIVILNRRKSAIWNLKSIRILRKYKCKLINFSKLINNNEKLEISNLQRKCKSDFKNFWNDNKFESLFSFNGDSYWNCIKDLMILQYQNEILEYIENIFQSKKIFENFDVNYILYQFESGNSENATIATKQNVPSILLRHGFSSYYENTYDLRWRYDTFRFLKLNCDAICVWGNADFDYYSKFLNLSNKTLHIVGSPRHDDFFLETKFNNTSENIVLITTPPITEWSGLLDTNVAIKYETYLRQLITILKKIPNVKIIGKLHPGWGWKFNDVLIEIFKNIDPDIPVYSLKSIRELLSQCKILINITPEDNEPSTVMLEGLIMNKPIIDISLDETNNNLDYSNQKPMISISYKADIEKYIKKILNDQEFENILLKNAKRSLSDYLAFPGSSHQRLGKILNSYVKS